MFQDDYKIWKKTQRRKNWTQFKIDFAIAHAELMESSQTAYSAVFQANNVTDVQRYTAAAISNLVNATQADRDSMASLTSTVTTLTASLASANDKLVQSLAQITVLEKELAAAKANKQYHAGKVTARTH